jgi:hypothetical protein
MIALVPPCGCRTGALLGAASYMRHSMLLLHGDEREKQPNYIARKAILQG